MAETTGYVKVYESSDGGTGNPVKTVWAFFVVNDKKGEQVTVTTENQHIAETMRLAISTIQWVRVTYDDETNVMSQARIAYEYICEYHNIYECVDGKPVEKEICDTRRLAPCQPAEPLEEP